MKRFIAQLLVMIVMLGSVLASPAVMAWSMESETRMDDCALCQNELSNQPHSASATASCAVAACAMAASMNRTDMPVFHPAPAAPFASPSAHRGRLLEGPDPFPPRDLHA